MHWGYCSVVLLVAGALGCGGSSASSTSVQGTVMGHGFRSPSAVFARGTVFLGTPALLVYLSDTPNLCAELQTGFQVKNGSLLEWGAWVVDAQGHDSAASDAGTYTINLYGSGVLLEASLFTTVLDASCNETLSSSDSQGAFGKLVLDAASATSCQGTFHAQVGQQLDQLDGTFQASFCDLSDAGAGVCH